jgi:hypothetical protein
MSRCRQVVVVATKNMNSRCILKTHRTTDLSFFHIILFFFFFKEKEICITKTQQSLVYKQELKMTRLLSAFGKAASFTARGASVTLGSTVFSCVVACNIEKGANRMIFKHYPHKFANVEAASGITQEELDFAKFIYGGSVVVATTDQETDESSSTQSLSTKTKDTEVLFRLDSYDDASVVDSSRNHETRREKPTTINSTEINALNENEQEEGKSTVNKFWTEGEEAAAKAFSMIPIIVPRQEILACSMTS